MDIKRRDFVKATAAAAAGISLSGKRAGGGQERPNVLVVLVDQMRFPMWTPDLRTPNIDRLAARGVSFTNGFTAASPCSPSRACILTGTYTTQNQVYQNVDWLFGAQPSLDPEVPTMGHVFGEAGYQTPYRGKWHLTKKRERRQALAPYGFSRWVERDPETGKVCNCGENAGGLANCGFNQDHILARQSADWILDPANRKGPWSMVCSLVNPHDICSYPRAYPHTKKWPIRSKEPPPNYNDDLSTKPGIQKEYADIWGLLFGRIKGDDTEAWRRYLDFYMHCIEDVDEHIGTVLDALEESGQSDNTIVVFTSDHGEMAGSHQQRVKGPMAYDEVMKVPFMISWPGHIPEGVKTDSLASTVDILPTIISLSGIKGVPYQAGIDLSPELMSPGDARQREEVIFHMNGRRDPDEGKNSPIMSLARSPMQIRCIRTKDWKYAQYFTAGKDESEEELYNLSDDPLEMKNLARDPGYRQKAAELNGRLTEEEERLDREYDRA